MKNASKKYSLMLQISAAELLNKLALKVAMITIMMEMKLICIITTHRCKKNTMIAIIRT